MADDLISRQAAIEWFTQKEIEFTEKFRPSIKLSFANGIARALAKLSPVDAVEVVRCRDCKWYEQMMYSKDLRCCRVGGMEAIEPNGFCSLGERRE